MVDGIPNWVCQPKHEDILQNVTLWRYLQANLKWRLKADREYHEQDEYGKNDNQFGCVWSVHEDEGQRMWTYLNPWEAIKAKGV